MHTLHAESIVPSPCRYVLVGVFIKVRTAVVLSLLLVCETTRIFSAGPKGGIVSVADLRNAAVSDSLQPVLPVRAILEQYGKASFYANKFHGRRTASGRTFDMNDLTAAHRTLPFGSIVRVTNPSNGTSIIVQVNDRGPFVRSRIVDLSRGAARSIGVSLHKVELEGFVPEEQDARILAFRGSQYEPVTLRSADLIVHDTFEDFSEAVRKHRILSAKNPDESVYIFVQRAQTDNDAKGRFPSLVYGIASVQSPLQASSQTRTATVVAD
jgi:rare lipoprotein A (peptidoglycan hydrolase)